MGGDCQLVILTVNSTIQGKDNNTLTRCGADIRVQTLDLSPGDIPHHGLQQGTGLFQQFRADLFDQGSPLTSPSDLASCCSAGVSTR